MWKCPSESHRAKGYISAKQYWIFSDVTERKAANNFISEPEPVIFFVFLPNYRLSKLLLIYLLLIELWLLQYSLVSCSL